MTLALTVAICGRLCGQIMVAIIFPAEGRTGLQQIAFFPVSMANSVQSAVNPVPIWVATLGIKDRPIGVAPARTISGREVRMIRVRLLRKVRR